MIVNILLFLLLSGWVLGFTILYRNIEVAKLRMKLNELCFEYCLRHAHEEAFESPYRWFYDKLPTYGQMLWSFKRLTIDQWAPREDIKKLFS